LKLDIGCGKNKKDGFVGVDIIPFDGVDRVFNAGKETWPFNDGEVDEVYCSHFLEHLEADERIHFVNNLYRVMSDDAKATIITPHWCSARAYGDLTHKWPPVSEFWFYYLNKDWRAENAPHNTGYICDFDATWGYGLSKEMSLRNQEYQLFAINNYKEAAQDIVVTLSKKKPPKK